MISCEIVVWLPNVLEIACSRIYDLNIACHVFISPVLAEVGECLVGNACKVQLMVTYMIINM